MAIWGCDAPESKQFIELKIMLEGQSRQIDLSFPGVIEFERARSLAIRALEVYSDPASRLPSCTSGASSDPKLDELNVKDPFPAGWKSAEVSVSRDAAGHAVWLHDVSVEIGFPVTAGEVGAQGLCWDEVIVVT